MLSQGCNIFADMVLKILKLSDWLDDCHFVVSSVGQLCIPGTMILGLLVLNHEGYNFERWHGTLLFYAIISLSLFINTFLAPLLTKL